MVIIRIIFRSVFSLEWQLNPAISHFDLELFERSILNEKGQQMLASYNVSKNDYLKPLRSRMASNSGSRPLKLTYISIASIVPPFDNICSL